MVPFDEIKAAVAVSNNISMAESDLFHCLRPLGKYYSDNGINKIDKLIMFDKKMMRIRDEIIQFRKEFEASFLITECEECFQPQPA